VSDAKQGRSCDGNGVCTNLPKPNGAPCTAAGQCNSGYCIDGVCCNTDCRQNCYSCTAGTPGNCTPLATGMPDHSATTPCDGAMQYCQSGTCQQNKKPNGSTCSAASECGSTYCVDGYCCNSTCTGTCQSCAVAGKLGSCVNLPAGTPDDNATVKCSLPTYCDAAGTCQSSAKANGFRCTTGTECASGFCTDGFCCDSWCTDTCRACNLPQLEGTCSLTFPGGTDMNASPTCGGTSFCGAGGVCATGKKPNGTTCVQNNECGSNYCIDGVCCDSACFGRCMSCTNSTGTCAPVAAGTDPRQDCPGAYECAGTCDGAGGCIFPAAGTVCGISGCASDGVIQKKGTCNGAGACSGGVLDDCKGFTCYTDPADGTAKCRTSCATDPNCQVAFYCDDTANCPADFPNAHSCVRDAQCQSNHCAISPGATTGVCCDRDCRTCGSCNLPGKEGTCVPVPAGQDPENDCIDSASDPTGKCGGKCNGQWGCEFPKQGTVCGTCKVCDGASRCNVMPDDDAACGDIACDMLNNTCNEYHPLKIKRCASAGVCKKPTVDYCTDVTVLCQPDAGNKDSGGPMDATTTTTDATTATDGPKDATTTPPDATTAADGPKDATTTPVASGGNKDAAGGTDAPAPKGGGGAGCCSVRPTGARGAVPAMLALGLAFVLAGRRRRRG